MNLSLTIENEQADIVKQKKVKLIHIAVPNTPTEEVCLTRGRGFERIECREIHYNLTCHLYYKNSFQMSSRRRCLVFAPE